MQSNASSRAPIHFEILEHRRLLTVVPIDATVGQPIKQPVATHVRLPSYSTGPDEVQVVIGAQQDYEPTVVANSDGTYDVYPI